MNHKNLQYFCNTSTIETSCLILVTVIMIPPLFCILRDWKIAMKIFPAKNPKPVKHRNWLAIYVKFEGCWATKKIKLIKASIGMEAKMKRKTFPHSPQSQEMKAAEMRTILLAYPSETKRQEIVRFLPEPHLRGSPFSKLKLFLFPQLIVF